MIRRPTLILILLIGAVSVALFTVKYRVQELEGRLVEMNGGIVADREAIHVLKAEWSHLNDPARLRDLAGRYLDLRVVGADRVADIDQIEQRLPEKPASEHGEAATDIQKGAEE